MKDDCGRPPATRRDLFEHWTPEECWLAGLLWADGYYDARDRRVQLNLTDEEAIAGAARVAGCGYRTYAAKPTSDGFIRKPLHRLTFGNRVAVPRLVAIGFAEPKLTTRPWPDLPHQTSFLRGLFDGDGSVMLHQQGGSRKTAATPFRLFTQLCGSPLVLDGVQRFMVEYGVTPKKLMQTGEIKSVRWNHRDSLIFASVIYSEDGPLLSRKRSVYDAA